MAVRDLLQQLRRHLHVPAGHQISRSTPGDPTTFPAQFTQTFGTSGLRFKDAITGIFAQDDWQVRTGLTLNLGIRWDKDSLFQGDNNNFSPRAGFAWNLGNEGRTVIRGNTGIFYDTLESSAINRESNTGPVGQSTIDLRRGDALFPAFPSRFDSFPTGAATVPRATVYVPVFEGDDFPFSIGDEFQRDTPYFFNTNIGIQHQLFSDWAVSADYTRVYGYDLLVTWDINAPPYFSHRPRSDPDRCTSERPSAAGFAQYHRRSIRHRIHRFYEPVSAIQRRQHRVQRDQARPHQTSVAALRDAGQLHIWTRVRRRGQLPARQLVRARIDGDRR